MRLTLNETFNKDTDPKTIVTDTYLCESDYIAYHNKNMKFYRNGKTEKVEYHYHLYSPYIKGVCITSIDGHIHHSSIFDGMILINKIKEDVRVNPEMMGYIMSIFTKL